MNFEIGKNGVVTTDDEIFLSGDRSLRLWSEGSRTLATQTLSLEGGKKYRLEVWYRIGEGLQHNDLRVRMQLFKGQVSSDTKFDWNEYGHVDSSGENTKVSQGSNLQISPDQKIPEEDRDEWHKLEISFTFPKVAELFFVELFNEPGGDRQGNIWFDDLAVWQLDE